MNAKNISMIIALAGTGVLSAGFFIGTVPLATLLTWLTGLGIGYAYPTGRPSDDDDSDSGGSSP